MNCLESEYIIHLRYSQSENRFGSVKRTRGVTHRSNSNILDDRHHHRERTLSSNNRELISVNSIEEEEKYKLVQTDIKTVKKISKANLSEANSLSQIESVRKFSVQTNVSLASDPFTNRCCGFLFSNQQNDFFSDNRRSKLNRKTKKTKKKLINNNKLEINHSGSDKMQINNKHVKINDHLSIDDDKNNQQINEINKTKVNICSKCNLIKSNFNSINSKNCECIKLNRSISN